jgi:hypothetical protein
MKNVTRRIEPIDLKKWVKEDIKVISIEKQLSFVKPIIRQPLAHIHLWAKFIYFSLVLWYNYSSNQVRRGLF